MTPVKPGQRPAGKSAAKATCCAAIGLAGSLACATSMVLVALGVGASAAAAGMASMNQPARPQHGLLGLLIRIGPALLIASIVLVTVAFALRRPQAAAPALLAGAVLYVGMYAQSNQAIMYGSIAVGYAAWIGTYLWVRASPLPARQHR